MTDASRALLLDLYAAALAAADPAACLLRAFDVHRAALPPAGAPVSLLAFGKAARPMLRAARSVYDAPRHELAVVPHTHRSDPQDVSPSTHLLYAGHPVPDDASVEAGRRALHLAGSLGPDDHAIVLLSGGASALLVAPAPGLTLDDLQRTTRVLLTAGVPIAELNVVRKHLSAIKGGHLARAIAPAHLLTFIVSDVVGDDLAAIASGPTVPDPSTFADALAVLDRHGLRLHLPPPVIEHLDAGAKGLRPETVKPSDPLWRHAHAHLVASGPLAADAVAERARALGLRARLVTTRLTGEARDVGVQVPSTAFDDHDLLIFAGETTVTVRGPGLGGRNQEAALAAAIALDGHPHHTAAFLATDGIDGPTDAAGAIVDGTTAQQGRALGLDPHDHLARNDSHTFLDAVGALVRTGPSGTNVNDLVMVLRWEVLRCASR